MYRYKNTAESVVQKTYKSPSNDSLAVESLFSSDTEIQSCSIQSISPRESTSSEIEDFKKKNNDLLQKLTQLEQDLNREKSERIEREEVLKDNKNKFSEKLTKLHGRRFE